MDCAVKVDMQKLYDKVDWNFLLGTMECMRFIEKWYGWIKECISSILYSVLVNGKSSLKSNRQGVSVKANLYRRTYLSLWSMSCCVTSKLRHNRIELRDFKGSVAAQNCIICSIHTSCSSLGKPLKMLATLSQTLLNIVMHWFKELMLESLDFISVPIRIKTIYQISKTKRHPKIQRLDQISWAPNHVEKIQERSTWFPQIKNQGNTQGWKACMLNNWGQRGAYQNDHYENPQMMLNN